MRNTQSPEHRECEVRIIEELRKNPDLSNRSIAALCEPCNRIKGTTFRPQVEKSST